jgi:hypothetical protein
MFKILSPLTISLPGVLFSTMSASAASLIPCATAANPQICSLCDILVLGNNLTNWAAGILLPLGILAFGISGVLYLIQKPDQAKSLMAAAAKGIIISLSAFLIVNVTLRALDVVQPTGWNTFTCTAQVAQNPSPTDKTTFNTTGDGGPKDTVGNPGDITGDPTVTPTTPICNENRDTSSIPMTLPLSLTLNCTNPDQIASAIWRFPSDSNFGSQTVDNKTGITFTSIDNPSNWTEVTVVVTDTKGRTQTYTYGFGTTVAVDEGPATDYCPGQSPDLSFSSTQRFQRISIGPSADDRASLGNLFRYQSMYAGDTFVIALNVPASDTTLGTFLAGFSYSDIGGIRAGRLVTISRSKCDFTSPKAWVNGSSISDPPRNAGSVDFAINEPSRSGVPNITTGTWYINIKVPVGQCPTGDACDFILDYGHITN